VSHKGEPGFVLASPFFYTIHISIRPVAEFMAEIMIIGRLERVMIRVPPCRVGALTLLRVRPID